MWSFLCHRLYVLERLYLNESYDNLIMRDPYSNQKVFFIPRYHNNSFYAHSYHQSSCSLPEDMSIIAQIESYGIIVVLNWANLDLAQFDQGEWV